MSRKDDANKYHPSYILSQMPQALQKVFAVAEYGANKYSPNGWKEVPDGIERYKEALLRHVLAYAAGQMMDTESGHQHLAHAAWNCLALMQLAANNEPGPGTLIPIKDADFSGIMHYNYSVEKPF